MAGGGKTAERTTGFRVEGLKGLSSNASRFVRRHPKQARMAMVAALEAAALQYRAEEEPAPASVPEALAPFVERRSPAEDTIGVSEAALRLQISRTTVYDWVDRKILLAWRSTKRGLRIPAEQILGVGKVLPGISRVLEIIEDPELTWTFLSQEWPFADDVARPIDKLKAGKVDEVAASAPSFGTTFT